MMDNRDLSAAEAEAATGAFLHWHGIATFLRCPYRPDMSETDIGLIGFPYSGGNFVERMQYLGPRAVRNRSAAYRRRLRGVDVDPFAVCRISDLGDVPVADALTPDLAVQAQQAFYERVDAAGIIPVTVGGDHSVTTPILRAIAGPRSRRGQPIGMIHFDAHSDTYPAAQGTRHHAGAAFRIGVEEGLIDPARTVQIGFRGPIGHPNQDAWSQDHFTIIPYDDIVAKGADWAASEIRGVIGDGPTYLSFDVDVLDPAYAPAVADPEVEGLTSREFFTILKGIRGVDLVGADVVCFCPPLDNPAQTTALLISQFLLVACSLIAERRASHDRGDADRKLVLERSTSAAAVG